MAVERAGRAKRSRPYATVRTRQYVQIGGFHMAESIYDVPVKRIDGTSTTLGGYRGKVLLVVNVASKCGLTPQYTGLETLYQAKHSKGLEIRGFPANNFAGQEPGTDAEIATFCSTNYAVTFPMFSKISVKGTDQHPLYRNLVNAKPQQKDDAE